jgi:serine/threonine protein kinase
MTTLGPYRILGKLGAGGMGEVYRAKDTKLDRDIAIGTARLGKK